METWSCKPEEDYTERDSKETRGDQWDNFCVFVFFKKHMVTQKRNIFVEPGAMQIKAGEEEKVLYVSWEL
jgi:hypothetical protein